jgi:hypothetical protein
MAAHQHTEDPVGPILFLLVLVAILFWIIVSPMEDGGEL